MPIPLIVRKLVRLYLELCKARGEETDDKDWEE
jgi:hypothetical protein